MALLPIPITPAQCNRGFGRMVLGTLAAVAYLFSANLPRLRSAGFQTCCVAGFQAGSTPLLQAGLETRDTADLEVCATLNRYAVADRRCIRERGHPWNSRNPWCSSLPAAGRSGHLCFLLWGEQTMQVANCQAIAPTRIFRHFSLDRFALSAKLVGVW